ncbi:MAG: DegT/DnrJ/EryC1/StrS family aminotransferase [Solirubrobacteraceae bacterium]
MSAQQLSAPAGAIPFFAGEREYAAHGEVLIGLVAAVLAGGQTLQGPAVEAFERALATAAGRANAVAVGSGTDALFFALRALGIGAGDEVLVPALSFIASASCVLRAGARPVFVDVDDEYLIDLGCARALAGPRTRAVIAVDLFGQMPDPGPLDALAAAAGIAVIEDAAQALGAERAGRRAGSLGRVSCVSFDPTKPLAAPGSGGALLCDDDALAARARSLRWHGRASDGAHRELGYNSQLSEAAAAVLGWKLGREPSWRARRQQIAASYDAALYGTALERPPRRDPSGHAFSKYVLRSPARDELRAALHAAGVPTRIHYPRPLHQEPLFACAASCPVAERASAEVLSLPIHAFLGDAEVARVCRTLGAAVAAT